MRSLLALALATAVAAGASARQPADGAPKPGDVSGARIRADVEFLASDLMEGRLAGTRGYDLAALYAATQLRAAGWEPAGADGSFFQQVPLLESTPVSSSLKLRTPSGGEPASISMPDEAIVAPGREHVEVRAPVVFAGYGVTAPERKWDDYAGVDVSGKLVAMVMNAPASFPSEPRAHYASFDRKIQTAAAHGAVGVVLLLTSAELAKTPWQAYRGFFGRPLMTWAAADGSPGTGDPRIKTLVLMPPAGAARLFAGASRTFETVTATLAKGTPSSLELPATLEVASTATHRRLTSPNVVARLRGADAPLAGTSVLITAHLDHIGVLDSGGADRIQNGAYDNAVGSAIVLDVARALAAAPRPKRSVTVALVTAEESGLVGSDYLARHLPPAVGKPIANVNLDMPLFLTPSRDLVAFGAENSTLETVVAEVARELDYTLTPDPMPAENLFVRSDQYSLVKQGVPAVYLMPGLTARDSRVNGQQIFGEFLAQHYHKPSDDVSRPMDLGALDRFARANLRLVQRIADLTVAPSWKPGNFFGQTFGK